MPEPGVRDIQDRSDALDRRARVLHLIGDDGADVGRTAPHQNDAVAVDNPSAWRRDRDMPDLIRLGLAFVRVAVLDLQIAEPGDQRREDQGEGEDERSDASEVRLLLGRRSVAISVRRHG